ncbi:MAG: LssY C-terminal domain-containing protein [Bryobacterales bacterium]|nr:LssY C-terminal domain-containing protein [Bryobacterales bacterium]
MRIPLWYLSGGLALAASGAICSGQRLPAGQSIEVRLLSVTGSKISKVGDPVEAVIISPVLRAERPVLAAGGRVTGSVALAAPLGFGFKRQVAKLAFRFDRLVLPDGAEAPVRTRLRTVDSARENVDANGVIRGIRPTTNVSSSLAVYAWRLAYLEPLVALPVWGAKFLFARAPDPEIQYPAGTELILELTSDVELGSTVSNSRPMRPLEASDMAAAKETLEMLGTPQAVDKNGRPADRVNLLFIATADELKRAFQGAGWTSADRRSVQSLLRTYRAVVERMGYSHAPVNNLLLAGQDPAYVFQKSLNTFARRHHGRVWRGAQLDDGRYIWLMAATEDTGIRADFKRLRFVHKSDPRAENERAKIVTDLSFTRCVDSGTLMRPAGAVPASTDNRVAVLKLNRCEEPFGQQVANARHIKPPLKIAQIWKSFENDLIRSNIIFVGYNTTKLTTATKALFAKRTHASPRGTDQHEQQSEWLADATLTYSDTFLASENSPAPVDTGESIPD